MKNVNLNKKTIRPAMALILLALLAGAVNAAHTHSAEVAPIWATTSASVEYTINIENNEGSNDNIRKVHIEVPDAYGVIDPCGTAPTGWEKVEGESDTTTCTYRTTNPGFFIEPDNNLDFSLHVTTAESDGTYSWIITTLDPTPSENWYITYPTSKVDGTDPEVLDLNISHGLINRDNIGETFTVDIEFSKTMNTEISPTISFDPPSPTGNILTGCDGDWTDSNNYEYTCTIADEEVEQEDIDITVEDAEDLAGNTQTSYTATDAFDVDTEAPSGYSVSIDQKIDPTYISSANETALSFTFTNAEEGATYDYNITSSGGGTPVTGTGTIENAEDQITGIDVSGLEDGELTLAVTLTDPAGNTGDTVTDTIEKNSAPPIVTSITPTQLNKDDAGTVTIEIEFNKDMNTDQNVTVQIREIDGSPIDVNHTEWTENTTWKGTFEFTDNNEEVDNAFYEVSGAKDDKGNTMEELTERDENNKLNVDTITPTLPTVTIESDNDNNTELAKVGDEITITITASENIQEPTVTIAGETADVLGEDNEWTATYPMQEADDEGTITFTIDFEDLAGNPGDTVTETTDTSQVTFDKTAPTGYSVSIVQTEITSANETALSFQILDGEIDANYNYTITSDGCDGEVTGSGKITEDTETIESINVSGLEDGELTLAVTLTDPAGNTGAIAEDTIVKDTEPPIVISITPTQLNKDDAGTVTIEIEFNKDMNTDQNVTVQISGITGSPIDVNHTEWSGNTTWKGEFEFTDNNEEVDNAFYAVSGAKDDKGNTMEALDTRQEENKLDVDTITPTLPTVTIASNNDTPSLAKVGDEITITITASENIQEPTVTIAGETADVLGEDNEWTATYPMQEGDDEGPITFTIDFEDLAGNPGEEVTTTTDASQVTFDKTAPTALITGVSTEWVTSDVITLRCTDPGPSGCFGTAWYYFKDDNDCSADKGDYTEDVVLDVNGDYELLINENNMNYVCLWVEDNAGNSDYSSSDTPLRVDTAPPELAEGSTYVHSTRKLTLVFDDILIGDFDESKVTVSNNGEDFELGAGDACEVNDANNQLVDCTLSFVHRDIIQEWYADGDRTLHIEVAAEAVMDKASQYNPVTDTTVIEANWTPKAQGEITLSHGWNFISIPFELEENDTATVLGLESEDLVYHYYNGTWSQPTELEALKGYLVFKDSFGDREIVLDYDSSMPPTFPGITVMGNRWNMIGPDTPTVMDLNAFLPTTGAGAYNYITNKVLTYDNDWIKEETTLDFGTGYFVYFRSTATIAGSPAYTVEVE